MIVNYSFENFQSYMEVCDVDFSVNSKTPTSYYDYETDQGKKVAKVMAVIGANGSGKSSMLKPLSFASWFVTDSFGDMKKGEKIPVIPHRLKSEKSTKISIDFMIPKWVGLYQDDEIEFRYILEVKDNYVIEETLKLKTSRQYSRVFERKYNNLEDNYRVKLSRDLGPDIQESFLEKAPRNCSLISYIKNLIDDEKSNLNMDSNVSIIRLVHSYFFSIFSNLTISGRTHLTRALDTATNYFSNHPDDLDFAKKLLKQYDLGIDDIRLENANVVNFDGTKSKELIPICIHNTSAGTFEIPMFMESSGTQSAYCIIGIVSRTLGTGGLIVLDEFDNDFHPELSMSIINLFKDVDTNPRNAQLLFNTHTVEVLKHLRRQHVYFVEKNDGQSDSFRGDQIEGLKDRDNLYKKYISGALGAFPEID